MRNFAIAIVIVIGGPVAANEASCENLSTERDATKAFNCITSQEKTIAVLKEDLADLKKLVAAMDFASNQHEHQQVGSHSHNELVVPKGVVWAFNLAEGCPHGWTAFDAARGRVIIGANPNRLHGYLPRPFDQVGGYETVVLNPSQMPSHAHGGVPVNQHGQDGRGGHNGNSRDNVFGPHSGGTSAAGGNAPHENMPPYIALNYCEKE